MLHHRLPPQLYSQNPTAITSTTSTFDPTVQDSTTTSKNTTHTTTTSAAPSRLTRLLKSLFLFRPLSTTSSAFNTYTLALCVSFAENIPSSVSSVYASLEGPGVAGAFHRTARTSVESSSSTASFRDASPIISRVSPANVRLALRTARSGTLLGDARLDVRALATRAVACRLRVPLRRAMTNGKKKMKTHNEGAMSLTIIALAAKSHDPAEESSWDSTPLRREVSDAVLPSATAIDVRRRLRCALRTDKDFMDEDKEVDEDEDEEEDVYGWSDLDDFGDVDIEEEEEFSALFQKVDTARPVLHEEGKGEGGTGDPRAWMIRTAKSSCKDFHQQQHHDSVNDDDDAEDNVITRGPIEYI